MSSQLVKMNLPPSYHASQDPERVRQRQHARRLLSEFNATATQLHLVNDIDPLRQRILRQLLTLSDENDPPYIEPPFQCDYGFNIHVGRNVYMNFGCTILDCAPVTIGDNALFGPNVQLYCPGHPFDIELRRDPAGLEFALPITIENDVWLGGGVIVLPGVTIGQGSVVGAGSVVTKDVPAMSVVAGNPCRFIRSVEPGDFGLPRKKN